MSQRLCVGSGPLQPRIQEARAGLGENKFNSGTAKPCQNCMHRPSLFQVRVGPYFLFNPLGSKKCTASEVEEPQVELRLQVEAG